MRRRNLGFRCRNFQGFTVVTKQSVRRMASAIGASIFAVLPLPAWPAAAQVLAELEVDHALTFEVQTPHINWARPFARGKSRVLFFIGDTGTNFRESVELMQRFDIEVEAVFYAAIVDTSRSDWHGREEGIKRMEALLKHDWDAYVFLNISPTKLPEMINRKLAARVQAGSGVLLSGADDRWLFPDSAATGEPVPFLAGIDRLKAFALGKGRGVRLPATPEIAYGEGWQNVYESWLQDLGRALLWAAGKSPQSALSFALSKKVFNSAEPVTLRTTWSGAPVGANPILQLWIRKPVGWVAPWPDRELAVGENKELTIPHLPAGRYHLDGRVTGSAGVETWTTMPFEVRSPRMISRIELKPDWGEIGGKIPGNVTLDGPVAADEKIRIDVLDKNRRVLMRRDFAAGRDRIDFSFDIPPWLPMLTSVEAALVSRNETLAAASRYFHVTRRNRNQFNFLIWDLPRGTLAPYAEESLARTGVTLQLAHGNPPLHVAANEIAWVPYTTHI